MSSFWLCIVLVVLSITILIEADAHDRGILEIGIDYVEDSIRDSPTELLTDPENNRGSIKYELFTPSNPKKSCYLEPTTGEFDNCSYNPSYETKFLIIGFVEKLRPGNLFEDLKDALLNYKKYNIIYVDWSLYNNFPLSKAIDNIPKVGQKVSEMVDFMMNHTGVTPDQLHCIGHSLGAHVCGHAARHVSNFSRVTGLDPGGITIVEFYKKNILLKYTDANFVDVIHTSFIQTGLGLGIIQPVGHMDFYVNGGIVQKPCQIGRKYRVFAGDVLTVRTIVDINLCDHYISIEYFTNSIRTDCKFLGTKCRNFKSAVLTPVIKLCPSNSSVTAKMGFPSHKIPGLPPKSVFYVDTLEFSPYCKERK